MNLHSLYAKFLLGYLIFGLLGFIAYRLLMNVDLPVGNTLPAVVITMVLCYIVNKLVPSKA